MPRIILSKDHLGWWMTIEKEETREKEEEFISHIGYIFPGSIEILAAVFPYDRPQKTSKFHGSSISDRWVDSLSFLLVPLGKRKFPGMDRRKKEESWWFDWKAREISTDESSARLIRVRRRRRRSQRLDRTDENNGETKSGKKFSDNGAENRGSVATCWPQLHWKLIST